MRKVIMIRRICALVASLLFLSSSFFWLKAGNTSLSFLYLCLGLFFLLLIAI